MHLKCCYSSCKSDSRKSEPGIKFMPFPKPNNYGNNWEQQNWQLADCISAAVLCFQGRAILSRHITWRTSEPKQKQMRNSLRPVLECTFVHPTSKVPIIAAKITVEILQSLHRICLPPHPESGEINGAEIDTGFRQFWEMENAATTLVKSVELDDAIWFTPKSRW